MAIAPVARGDLLSQRQLAARLGINVSTLRRWRKLALVPEPAVAGYYSWSFMLAWMAHEHAEATVARHPRSPIAKWLRRVASKRKRVEA